MFSDCINSHGYDLRTIYILKDIDSNMSSGNICIRHYMPIVIDTGSSKNDTLNKIKTDSLHGFAFYIKRIWLNKYKTEWVERNLVCL